jgi:hypothetical protein
MNGNFNTPPAVPFGYNGAMPTPPVAGLNPGMTSMPYRAPVAPRNTCLPRPGCDCWLVAGQIGKCRGMDTCLKSLYSCACLGLLRTVQTLIYNSRKAFDDGTEHCIEQQLKFLLLCG